MNFEPRTGCGFFVYGKFSKLIVKYKMPISLFVQNYTMTTAEDPDTITYDSLDEQRKEFTVSNTRLYFYFVNWD